MGPGVTSAHLEKYEPFFGLNETPFSLAPDVRFLFESESFSSALEQLIYAFDRREPVVVVTGEIGTGKTLLCRAVLQKIPRKTFLSIIADPMLERDELLKQLLEDFGVIARDRSRLTQTTRHDLIEALHAFLRSLRAIQAHAVVVVDEAQHLKPDVLEQIRLLSNLDDERGTLLQIILVGQPELESLLARPELRQIQQRVSRRFKLEPFNADEAHRYIEHRLALARDSRVPSTAPGASELAHALAEWSGEASLEFTSPARQAVFDLSGGLPRVINLLCDRALEEACASRLHTIDVPVIDKAAGALGFSRRIPPTAESSFWSPAPSPSTAAPVEPPRGVPERVALHDVPAPPRRTPPYVLLAGTLAVATFVAVWLGLRASSPSAAQTRSSPTPAAAPVPTRTPSAADRASAPADAPKPAAPSAASRATGAGSPTPSPAAAPAGERFEIVVASFRTEVRATAVAAEVAAIGLPVRQRASDSWQQVIAGPFTSRAQAEEAQQNLQHAGLGGTQIVPAR